MDKCVSCGSADLFAVPYINNQTSTRTISWDKLSVKCCKNCGLGFAFPLVTAGALLKFYQEDYHSDPQSYSQVFFTRHIPPGSLFQALNVALFVDLSQKEEINYLDIGCGAFGQSFNAFAKVYHNKKVNHFGIDADPLAKKMLEKNGITWLGDDYNSLKNSGKQFDIITLSHCLEHLALEDSLRFLETTRDYLTKEGVLFIEVPHDDFRNTQRHASPSSPHTIFFTPEALSNISAARGYSVLFCTPVGPNMEAFWQTLAAQQASAKTLRQYLKSFIPVYVKERLKNIFGDNSTAAFLKSNSWINRRGAFLRIILKKAD
jgi:SAM-dependent methyltransferase